MCVICVFCFCLVLSSKCRKSVIFVSLYNLIAVPIIQCCFLLLGLMVLLQCRKTIGVFRLGGLIAMPEIDDCMFFQQTVCLLDGGMGRLFFFYAVFSLFYFSFIDDVALKTDIFFLSVLTSNESCSYFLCEMYVCLYVCCFVLNLAFSVTCVTLIGSLPSREVNLRVFHVQYTLHYNTGLPVCGVSVHWTRNVFVCVDYL